MFSTRDEPPSSRKIWTAGVTKQFLTVQFLLWQIASKWWHGVGMELLTLAFSQTWKHAGNPGVFLLQTQTIRKAYPCFTPAAQKRMIANISFITDSLFCNSNQSFKSNSNTAKTEKRFWTKIQESRNWFFLFLQKTLKANALCCTDGEESLHPFMSIYFVAHLPCTHLHERD